MKFPNPWLLLAVAIVVELIGTTSLKASRGFTEPVPSLATAISLGVTLYLGGLVVKRLPLGVTYAVWAGVGTGLTAAAGVLIFGEVLQPVHILGIASIIAGAIILRLGTPG